MITHKKILEWMNNGTLDRRLASSATSKGHKHLHNPTTKPSYTRTALNSTPAQYRRKHYGKRTKR